MVTCLNLWCVSLRAQPLGMPEIINFSKSDYKAGTQNWGISQSENGIMFFGNNKGILEFDGTNWALGTVPNETTIRSIACDEDGIIWVGAQDELGFLAVNQLGRLRYHSLVDSIPRADRSFEDVWKVFLIQGAQYYCTRNAIFKFTDSRLDIIRSDGGFENFFQVGDDLYVQDIGTGLKSLVDGVMRPVNGGERFKTGRIAGIVPHDAGIMIISDFDGIFQGTAQSIEQWDVPVSRALRSSHAYCAVALKDGSFAVGTVQEGLYIIAHDGSVLLHLDRNNGLQNNTVLSLFQDRQHNLWLGLDNGIDYIKVAAPFSFIGSFSGISGTGYTSILHNDLLYLGTNQGLYYAKLDNGDDQFSLPYFQKIESISGQVWSLNPIGNDLVVSAHEGAYRVDQTTVRAIESGRGTWQFFSVAGNHDQVIAGTYNGLRLFNHDESGPGSGWSYQHEVTGFDESARVIEADGSDLWVSHYYKGLFRLKPTPGFERVEVDYFDEADGLPSTININVAKVNDDVLFTTAGGVYTYDHSIDSFVPHSRLNALLGAPVSIHRIIEDRTGQVWFSTDEEFGLLKVKDNGFLSGPRIEKRYFNHLQDILVDGFEHVFALDTNNFLIAAEKGFVHYAPRPGETRNLEIETVVREIAVLTQQDSSYYGGWQTSDNSVPDVTVPPGRNSIRVSYSATFFEHFGQVEYRHKLVGYDDEWSDWSKRGDKEYTNLPYGDYTFIVQSRNAFGTISEPRSLGLSVQPKWYETHLFRFGTGLLLLAVIALVFRILVARFQKEKAALEEKQETTLRRQEEQFMEEKARSDAEIVKLRNANLKADIQHKSAQLASATMHIVQKGEILLKIKSELNRLQEDAPDDSKRRIQTLIRSIDEDLRLDESWEQFEVNFDAVHQDFLRNLRDAYPQLTPKDRKLCAYLKMNLSTKEIAPLMNISVRGVEISRYRLRKKLGITKETNLVDFITRLNPSKN